MQPHKKFAFDVGITFFASVVTLSLGFVITVLLGRYLGAGDLGLYRMASTIYGIAMLIVAIDILSINCCNHLSSGQKRFPLFELIFALEFKPQDLILEPWYFQV